jgi:uncharacterized protein (DUF1778 family)
MRVRLSPAEKARVMTAARVNHQNLSQFARDALVTAADDCLEQSPRRLGPRVVFFSQP